MILDLLPTIASFVFNHRMKSLRFSFLQVAILLAIGLQRKSVDDISYELDLPVNQVSIVSAQLLRLSTNEVTSMAHPFAGSRFL